MSYNWCLLGNTSVDKKESCLLKPSQSYSRIQYRAVDFVKKLNSHSQGHQGTKNPITSADEHDLKIEEDLLREQDCHAEVFNQPDDLEAESENQCDHDDFLDAETDWQTAPCQHLEQEVEIELNEVEAVAKEATAADFKTETIIETSLFESNLERTISFSLPKESICLVRDKSQVDSAESHDPQNPGGESQTMAGENQTSCLQTLETEDLDAGLPMNDLGEIEFLDKIAEITESNSSNDSNNSVADLIESNLQDMDEDGEEEACHKANSESGGDDGGSSSGEGGDGGADNTLGLKLDEDKGNDDGGLDESGGDGGNEGDDDGNLEGQQDDSEQVDLSRSFKFLGDDLMAKVRISSKSEPVGRSSNPGEIPGVAGNLGNNFPTAVTTTVERKSLTKSISVAQMNPNYEVNPFENNSITVTDDIFVGVDKGEAKENQNENNNNDSDETDVVSNEEEDEMFSENEEVNSPSVTFDGEE